MKIKNPQDLPDLTPQMVPVIEYRGHAIRPEHLPGEDHRRTGVRPGERALAGTGRGRPDSRGLIYP